MVGIGTSCILWDKTKMMKHCVTEIIYKMRCIKDIIEDTIQEIERNPDDLEAIKELTDEFVTKNFEELVIVQDKKTAFQTNVRNVSNQAATHHQLN